VCYKKEKSKSEKMTIIIKIIEKKEEETRERERDKIVDPKAHKSTLTTRLLKYIYRQF
jgi:hypothetical protein